ncbi:hypothetical protein GCM10010503_58430 [Streptomyces lucensis JCM 4490]|uniref:LigA protein n=1 Tax=Streptomyces lucensis JCM 4490 TaxID=1306176 RepID=A0A918MUA6_9ACTN|nr:hypothetical protein [Streptomyces lucensis]GGW73242.1 hypothetical protein GCM10010503_58430 [Streptomyces lucensis JCM 4490]
MTQSLPSTHPGPSDPAAALPGRRRRLLRLAAVAACVPYLSLKAAWISGSRIGIPAGSSLLDHRTALIVANGLSMLADAAVIVLALVLTRPWGLRAPAWLLVFPAWAAGGLLAPIMTGYPLQLLVRVLGGGGDHASGGTREPFLDEWVFGVVYGGFIVQGLALGTLFALYARDRWGHAWRGTLRQLPAGPAHPAQRVCAALAALAALLPLATHTLWAAGGASGLGEGRGERTSDFHVVEAVYVLFLLAALAGACLLAFRWVPGLPVRVPLALAWTGSGATACWGAYLLLVGLADAAGRPTPLTNLTYAGQMIVGILVAALGVHFLAERSAAAAERPPA